MTLRLAALCGLVAMLQVSACARRDDTPATAANATAVAATGASAASAASAVRPADGPVLKPVAGTEPVPHDADDPAIWVHPSDPIPRLVWA